MIIPHGIHAGGFDDVTCYEFCRGCNDCTDYVLPLKKGDCVRVVEKTSRGCLVKHGGTSGWYYGRLGEKGEET